ncbi:MAG: hypothetical protein OEV64_01905 [Desulfobulbaceae bacterium]|nr:hypothetical protein [Desulfobulbaceae bacterium]
MMEQLGSFGATGNDGNHYTVVIYQKYINVGTLENPSAVAEGMKILHTADGMHVNRHKQGEYEIVETGVILNSKSPEAP